MWFRSPAIRGSRRRSAVVVLAALSMSGLALPAADAAPGSTLTLDPAYVEVGASPVENGASRAVAVPVAKEVFHRVPVRSAGSVTVTVPPELTDTGHVGASVEVRSAAGAWRKTYRSNSKDPSARLGFTPLGNGRYRVQLPTDSIGGDRGYLNLGGFVVRGGVGVTLLDPWGFSLEFSAAAPQSVALTQQFFAQAYQGASGGALSAPSASVAAGSALTITLPAGSRFSALGIRDLRTSAAALQVLGTGSLPPATPPLTPPITPGVDARSISLAVPADLTPGRYLLTVVMGDGTGQFTATEMDVVQVTPAVAARSSDAAMTTEAAATSAASATSSAAAVVPSVPPSGSGPVATVSTASSSWPLVSVGVGTLLLAGVVIGGVFWLQRRRHGGAVPS
jgi:hypothetical protein